MTEKEQPRMLLLYGIAAAGRIQSVAAKGLADEPVVILRESNLAAIVSPVRDERLRPERRFLMAFDRVLRDILDQTTFLPSAFGIVADSERQLRQMLRDQAPALTKQLKQLDGKVEMGVTITWDGPTLFRYFIDKSPQLRDMRDRLYAEGREPSTEDKIELGRMFERVRGEQRQHDSDLAADALRQYQLAVLQPRTDEEVARLACLVPRDAIEAFRDAVHALADQFDDNYNVKCDGPWAPYNFVNLRLHLVAET